MSSAEVSLEHQSGKMSSPSAGKRRMDTDVIKLIESQVESLTQFFPIFSFNMVSQVFGEKMTPLQGFLCVLLRNLVNLSSDTLSFEKKTLEFR